MRRQGLVGGDNRSVWSFQIITVTKSDDDVDVDAGRRPTITRVTTTGWMVAFWVKMINYSQPHTMPTESSTPTTNNPVPQSLPLETAFASRELTPADANIPDPSRPLETRRRSHAISALSRFSFVSSLPTSSHTARTPDPQGTTELHREEVGRHRTTPGTTTVDSTYTRTSVIEVRVE